MWAHSADVIDCLEFEKLLGTSSLSTSVSLDRDTCAAGGDEGIKYVVLQEPPHQVKPFATQQIATSKRARY